MNSTQQTHQGSGNWIAFLFGAIFNLLAKVDLSFLTDYALQAVVGGVICLMFKMLGDMLQPYIKRQQEKILKIKKQLTSRKKKP